MKAFSLLLALAFASYFVDVESRLTMAQITNGIKTVKKSCLAKSGVSKELFEATHNGEFAEDKALMCFYHCAMNMMQTLKNGKFDPALVVRQADTMLPENLAEQTKVMSEKCSLEATSEDPCEQSWQYAKCNWETDKEVFFFP